MSVIERHSPARHRTIFLSDIHLGTRGCNAEMLIDFLDHCDSDHLYLVGDMIDGWRMKKRFFWPERHNAILRRIMKKSKGGTQVTYIPGNHDEMFRQFTGLNFGGVEIRRAAFHTTADGRRLMVLHGDEFDTVMLAHRWLAFVGDAAYHLLMGLNRWVNAVRNRFDLPYWSLSKMAKHKVKNAVEFISKYEEVVARAAGERGVDGVVCGHIHESSGREDSIGSTPVVNAGPEAATSCTRRMVAPDLSAARLAAMVPALGAGEDSPRSGPPERPKT